MLPLHTFAIGEDGLVCGFNLGAPSPLVGEGGEIERSEIEPGEGSASAETDPSPASLCSAPSPTRGEGNTSRRRTRCSHCKTGRHLKHRAVADHLERWRAVRPALEGELAACGPGAAFENLG